MKSNIGSLLLEEGRITEHDIERALEHQRLQGGYFGQALVDLGIVQQEELDFGLASQAQLPYVSPDASSIDPGVAGLVPGAWAARHNAMPIARHEGWLTLLVDSPLKTGLADELAQRTGLSVKLALSSTRQINRLIRKIYRLGPGPDASGQLMSLEAFWTLAASSGSNRWGLTVRHEHVTGWIRHEDTTDYHSLIHSWLPSLDRLLSPPPSQVLPAHGQRRWRANVRPDLAHMTVMVSSLSGPGGHEMLFSPIESEHDTPTGMPGSDDLATLRKALTDGPQVIAAQSPDGLAARELVTRLPRILLKPGHRTICLLREGAHAISEDTLVLTLSEDGNEDGMLGFLKYARLDAVGLDITPTSHEQWEEALNLAPLTMLVLTGRQGEGRLPPGIGWLLSTRRDETPQWELARL